MQRIRPPDSHHLNAAMGWLGLDAYAEADAELDNISQENRHHPDVLEVRWALCAEKQSWAEALEVARHLVTRAPRRASGWLHQAYALRRAPEGGVEKAWEALKIAAEKFPKQPTIAYNLSCYACQMKKLEEARKWFQRALAVGRKRELKAMALLDEDLKPLWAEISGM